MTEYRSHGRPSDQDLQDDTLLLYASRVAEIFPLRKRPDDEMHLRAPAMQPRCISEDRAINRTRRLLRVNYKAAILRCLAILDAVFLLKYSTRITVLITVLVPISIVYFCISISHKEN